jgi:predicted O-methyltransferase YrrM
LELGVASGGSLRAWERYCPLAKIVASDINPAARRFAGPRTTIEIVDHHNRSALAVLGKHAPLDFIIDDGDRQPSAVRTAYEVLWPLLRVGGVYVIEDLQVARAPAFHPETGAIFDGVIARLAAENVESGLTDRITIMAGELVAFVKVR